MKVENNNQEWLAFIFFERPESKPNQMIKRNVKVHYLIILLIFVFFSSTSCRKFDGDLEVPSYIKIDSISLSTEDYMGSESHKITTAWIYVDDQIVGIYELPTVAPVLAKGLHKVRIDAGINMNGIKSLRVYYPFYEAITQDMELSELDTIDLNASSYQSQTTYYDNTEFVWIVDFEDPSYNLDSLQPSDIDIVRTPVGDTKAYRKYDSQRSGMLEMTAEKDFFRIASNVSSGEGFKLERLQNIPIFLELNYMCNNLFTVGVYANGSSIEKKAVLVIKESAEWNKIYVNLKPVVDASVNAVDFNIYFEGAHKPGLENTVVYLDNIKLLTR